MVTGTRTERYAEDVVVPTEVITRRDIERSGAKDLAELLETQPGLDFEYGNFTFGGVGLRLQGMNPEQVMVLVDGQRITGRIRGLIDLSRIPVRSIERIEIIKGPGSALYGADAMGGVVNIITRSRSRPQEASITALYGERNELDLRGDAGLQRGAFTVRAGAGRRSNSPYDLNTNDPATTGSGTGSTDVNLGATWAPSPNFQLRVDSDYLWRDLTGVDLLPTGAIFDRRERTELFNAGTSARGKLGTGTTLSGSVRYSVFKDQLLQDQRNSRQEDSFTTSIERLVDLNAQVDHQLPARNLLSAGVEEAIFSQRTARQGADTRYRTRSAVFVQDEWQVFEDATLTLLPGFRVDIDSQFGTEPSPRIAARWAPRPDTSLRVAYGWGFRAPSFQELYLLFENTGVGYLVQGNPKLKPERSRGATVAADHRFNDDVSVSLSVFRNDLENLIEVVTIAEPTPETPLTFGYRNVGHALTQGGEASARLRLWPGGYLDVGYALTDARNLDQQRALEGRSMHRISAQVSGRIRPAALDLSLRVAWNSPRTFYPNGITNDVTVKTDPFAVIDARVGKRFFSWGSAFVSVNNALGAGDATYLPLPPRQFYGGVTLELP
ncbi:MAG: TonB-dependent receptor [Myxococcaceae bacterium]|nr:TonB-dependent receptor [Myxococcaceae bacterium]